MVVSEKILPPTWVCDGFRCELLGIRFVSPLVTRRAIVSPHLSLILASFPVNVSIESADSKPMHIPKNYPNSETIT